MPIQPVPSPRQLAWQKLETYAFVHFGPNAFTDREWGEGKEDPNLFNPTALDCRQWCKAFKDAGFKQVIITAKHHDGFCLWPSKFSTHTVAQSKWKLGKGDVLAELSKACKEYGLRMGVYLSPWDRNHPTYGTPEYNQVFANMLKEVLTQYGEIHEVWFDGANGEGPNDKRQVYDWDLFIGTVRQYAPNAVIFSDAGPDIRWVGNESGIAGETCWGMIDKAKVKIGGADTSYLNVGDAKAPDWVPAECDVSIRPGWFYHAEQDRQVKTPEQLMDLYERSVGRNGALLLNVPPDRRGLIHENDVKALQGFKKLKDATFAKNLARGARLSSPTGGNRPDYTPVNPQKALDGKTDTFWHAKGGEGFGELWVEFKSPQTFDRVVLQEPIALGQRVSDFTVDARIGGNWEQIAVGTTIGAKRILRTEPVTADAIRVTITKGRGDAALSEVGVYATPNIKRDMELKELEQDRDQRMAWWSEARFGMFIHWGLYSIPAGEWGGKNIPGIAEWIQYSAKVPVKDYEPLIKQFNPVKFDAKRWVQIAKDAGMKYLVITSKHHDGFGLWQSKLTDWDVESSPFHRDILAELKKACDEAGIKFCLYHSIMDWHHPDYLPRRPWDPRPEVKADFDKYVAYMKGQLKELVQAYRPGVVWFDGEWEDTWNHERGVDLYAYMRSLDPKLIVNNRVDKGRAGMAGMTIGDHMGDFGTPEQEIPPNGFPGVDWESCMTMNDTWGFAKNDRNWKSAQTLIEQLVDCASKGGNYLLNVGPTSLGEIPTESIERLAEVGKWLKANGEAIYGSKAGPFPRQLPWGRVTQKGNKLYLCVFDASLKEIELPGLTANIVKVTPLGSPSEALKYRREEDSVIVTLPAGLSKTVPVLVMDVNGPVTVAPYVIRQAGDGSITLPASDAVIHGSTARYEDDKRCIGYWSNSADYVSWEFKLAKPGEFMLSIELACEPGTEGSTFTVLAGTETVTGKVPATKGWSDFVTVELGKVSLVSPGTVKLEVRAKELAKGALMNLREVRLRRG